MANEQRKHHVESEKQNRGKFLALGLSTIAIIACTAVIPQLPNQAQSDQQTSQDFRQQLEDPHGKHVPGDFGPLTPLPITPVDPKRYTPEPNIKLTPRETPRDVVSPKIETPVAQATPQLGGRMIHEGKSGETPTPQENNLYLQSIAYRYLELREKAKKTELTNDEYELLVFAEDLLSGRFGQYNEMQDNTYDGMLAEGNSAMLDDFAQQFQNPETIKPFIKEYDLESKKLLHEADIYRAQLEMIGLHLANLEEYRKAAHDPAVIQSLDDQISSEKNSELDINNQLFTNQMELMTITYDLIAQTVMHHSLQNHKSGYIPQEIQRSVELTDGTLFSYTITG